MTPRRYCVERVKPDGKRFVVASKLTERQAVERAGQERDRMSDYDVSLGWDYVVARIKFAPRAARYGNAVQSQGRRRYQPDTRGGHVQ